MRYGKYYAVISLVSCEPIWGTVTRLGEQAVKKRKNHAGHHGKASFCALRALFIPRPFKPAEGQQLPLLR